MTGLERVPAPTVARERALALLEYAISESPGGDATYKEQAATLARELGDEIRVALAHEHEDDLDRARSQSFDLGVRTTLRILAERRAIPPTAEATLTAQLSAGPSRALLLERISGVLQPILDGYAAEESPALETLLAAVSDVLP